MLGNIPPQSADGFGIQRVYTNDLQLNETIAVAGGDEVLVPRGHHPCGAPYGLEMYYPDVMAGSLPKWRFVPAPEVKWIMKRDKQAAGRLSGGHSRDAKASGR